MHYLHHIASFSMPGNVEPAQWVRRGRAAGRQYGITDRKSNKPGHGPCSRCRVSPCQTFVRMATLWPTDAVAVQPGNCSAVVTACAPSLLWHAEDDASQSKTKDCRSQETPSRDQDVGRSRLYPSGASPPRRLAIRRRQTSSAAAIRKAIAIKK